MAHVDPVTLEVIQNRLMQIGKEGGIALQRTAASPITVDAKDLGFNVADHLGRTMVYAAWMPKHGTTLGYLIRSSIRKFEKTGIGPGDVIVVNNPYDGALHNQDIAVLGPVYYGDEIIAWTGCATHHLDVGGINPGWAAEATSCYQEGIIFPPTKIVEGGRLRQDVFDLFLENVRVPHLQGLDLKAQIASNKVAERKIIELAQRYGVDTLKTCYEEIAKFSEAKTRERIRQLPDGVYECVDVIDYERPYRVKLTLTVRHDTMTFDFTGTDGQAPSSINCAIACTIANVHNIIICMLIPDVAANEGCFRPVDFVIPERTIFNCARPAPCTGGSGMAGWKAQYLAINVLSQALARSSEWRRAVAGWGHGFGGLQLSGVAQHGRPFVFFMMETAMQGGGARATRDGVDAAGIAGSTNTSIPNVEAVEQSCPILYLYRKLVPDTGGAGKFRGGLSGEHAIVTHGVDSIEVLPFYMGKDTAPAGIFGGQPGTPCRLGVKRGTDVERLLSHVTPDFDEIAGEEVVLPQRGPAFRLDHGDVVRARYQGGGGYGDPRERDPDRVRRDVLEGYVSPEAAAEDYGVEVRPVLADQQDS